ncbi:MAG: hypothetical protein ACLUNQ_04145 [Oscillospiraceae bacterium]
MYDYALYGSSLNTLGTLGLIALVLAIVATVLAFILSFPLSAGTRWGNLVNSSMTPATSGISSLRKFCRLCTFSPRH